MKLEELLHKLMQGALKYDELPKNIELPESLAKRFAEIEESGNLAKKEGGARLIKVMSTGALELVDARLGDGNHIDFTKFPPLSSIGGLALFYGTFHTHLESESPMSFSGPDVVGVVFNTLGESVSFLQHNKLVHLLIRPSDVNVKISAEEIYTSLINQSLSDKGIKKKASDLKQDLFLEVGKQTQSIMAVTKAANVTKLGYYLGNAAESLMKMN